MANDEQPDTTPWVDERIANLNPGDDWQPDPAAGLANLRTRRAVRQAHVRRRIWATGAAIVLAAGVGSAFGPRAFAEKCVDACVAITSRVGQFLRPGQGILEPNRMAGDRLVMGNEIGALAPDFSLNDALGDPLQLSRFRGQVVLLNFWATWCGPCRIEIPWFEEFQTRYRDQGLVVLGLSLDDDGWKSVKPFADEQGIGYRLGLANDALIDAYGGLGALPATYLIDRQGRIVIKHIGLVERREYEAEITRLLTEK